MKKNMLNLRKNTSVEKIQEELNKIQKRCSCRTVSVKTLLNALRETEEKYSHYFVDVKKLIRIEYNAFETSRKDYYSSYFNKCSSPQSTWFTICYAGGWKVVDIYRGNSLSKTEAHLGHIDVSKVIKLLELPKRNTLKAVQVKQVENIEKWGQEVVEKYPLLYKQIQVWRWMLLREVFLGKDSWEELVEVERLINQKEKEIKSGKTDEICSSCETSRSMARRIVRDVLNREGRDLLVQVLNEIA